MDWITADWHWAHRKIRIYEPGRPENFQQLLVDNWRRVVQPQDRVFFLGDLVLGNSEQRAELAAIMRSLPGEKFAVRGNHCRGLTDAYFGSCGFVAVADSYWCLGRWVLSHYPMTNIDDRYADKVAEVRRVFDAHDCTLNIHGHTHSKFSPDPRCVNVSVDVTDFTPVSAAEIRKYSGRS